MTTLKRTEEGLPPLDRPGKDLARLGALTLAGLLATGLTGCMTVKDKHEPKQSSMMPTMDGDTENPFASKTDFTREMSPEQKFNVHVELGKVYESRGDFDAAVAEYEKAAELGEKKGGLLGPSPLGPNHRALAERRMGGAYDRKGQFAQADTHYRKALELAPKDAKVWNDVGYSYYLQQRLSDAELAFKTAESLDPGNPKILTNMGLALAAAGKEEEALTALSRAGGPAVGEANLGFILAAMGKTEEARRHYEAALARQPQLTAARDALARIDLARVSNPVTLASHERPVVAPATPSPTLPPSSRPLVTVVKPAPIVAPRDLSSSRASLSSSPKPVTTAPPVKTDEKSDDILDNLPELPPSMTGESAVKATSPSASGSPPLQAARTVA
ncbi:MAG: tetratricopeptide repeat protein, partial [Isosphaeraceae bacterium]